MTKLPLIPASQVMRLLQSYGFALVRTRGSHNIFQHADGRATVVPMHKGKDLPRPLLYEILRQAGISSTEYLDWLNSR
jgi:predicted RNA binding protein YcfA (HicA-like mRNA interferase family)